MGGEVILKPGNIPGCLHYLPFFRTAWTQDLAFCLPVPTFHASVAMAPSNIRLQVENEEKKSAVRPFGFHRSELAWNSVRRPLPLRITCSQGGFVALGELLWKSLQWNFSSFLSQCERRRKTGNIPAQTIDPPKTTPCKSQS